MPEKFSPPAVTNVVYRSGLHPRVPVQAASVTLVAATAGWGKTIFAASWLAARPNRTIAWVTLDEADDDPHAFCCAVTTALVPELNAQAVGVLHRVTADAVERDDLPRVIATALRGAPGPIALVLDNLPSYSFRGDQA